MGKRVTVKHSVSASLVIVALLFSAFASAVCFKTAKTSTSVTGIIDFDTTWTKADSPYTLTGNVLVTVGVTLSIESGVTVNFNGYYIMVNGTLRAQGSSADQINLKSGKIEFTAYSNGWNEQTGSGCIIENTISENMEIYSSTSLKLNQNSMQKASIKGNLTVITNNEINGEVTVGNSSVISNNIIKGGVAGTSTKIVNNEITGKETTRDQWGRPTGQSWAIYVSGSSVIENNKIVGYSTSEGGINIGSGYAYVSGNIVTNSQTGVRATGDATVEGNLLIDNHFGVVIDSSDVTVRNNTINNTEAGILAPRGGSVIIEKNLITVQCGYSIDITSLNATILNNTLGYNSSAAIKLNNCQSTTINYNNIEGYNYYGIRQGGNSNNDIDATYNWWGTTDTAEIDQNILDYYDDYNLGEVNYTPFLTEPNPNALPTNSPTLPTSPTPTPANSPSPTPEQTPTPTPPSQEPTQIEFTTVTGVAIITAVIGIGLGSLIYLMKRK